jgi:hypothetical protein
VSRYNELIKTEDRKIKVFSEPYITQCRIAVRTCKIYDAKNGSLLMEQITMAKAPRVVKNAA